MSFDSNLRRQPFNAGPHEYYVTAVTDIKYLSGYRREALRELPSI